MKSSTFLRISTLAAALGAALSAHAWIISVAGTSGAGGIGITGIDYQYSNLAALPTTFTAYGAVFNTATGAYTGTIANGAATLIVASTAGNVSLVDGVYSFSGIWTKQTGTTVDVNGSGTYSATVDTNTQRFEVNVGGTAPVPEPASLAALGLGAVGLLRRRKRA